MEGRKLENFVRGRRVAGSFESGAISEEEVIEQVRDLNNKMDYLHRKGQFEQRNLFDSFVSTVK